MLLLVITFRPLGYITAGWVIQRAVGSDSSMEDYTVKGERDGRGYIGWSVAWAVLLMLSLAPGGYGRTGRPPNTVRPAETYSPTADSLPAVPMPYIALRDQAGPGQIGSPSEPVSGTRVVYKPILFSALLPGSGQLYQGQDRGYLYIAAEAATIVGWVYFRNKGNDGKEEFIQYAWVYARENISTQNVRGDDAYYEHMARYVKSGEFDTDRNYDLNDPFTIDPTTESDSYNAGQWQIALITYGEPDNTGEYVLPTPADSLAALQYYATHAYQPTFYWDWTKNNTVDDYRARQNHYLDLRDESNLAFQRATLSLVFLMANHVVSVVDAFLSSRITLPGDGGENRTRLDMRLERGGRNFPGGKVRLTHTF